MTLLPSQAAIAAHHGLSTIKNEPAAIKAVEDYAMTAYLAGLATQGRASPEEQAAFYAKVGGLIGIEPALVANHRGRISEVVFAANLLGKKGQVIDTYDGTQASDNPTPEKKDELGAFDRSLNILSGVLLAPFTDYVRKDLGYVSDRPYIPLNLPVNMSWDRSAKLGGPDDLAIALAQNHDLKALVLHGYHDLNANYLMSRYVLEQTTRAGRTRASGSSSAPTRGATCSICAPRAGPNSPTMSAASLQRSPAISKPPRGQARRPPVPEPPPGPVAQTRRRPTQTPTHPGAPMTPDQILAFVLALTSPQPAAPAFPVIAAGGADNRYPVKAAPCPRPLAPFEIEGKTVACGTVSVPEDHAKPDGRRIPLTFMIFKSRSEAPAPDAVVHLHGGPGAGIVERVALTSTFFEGLRARRDVVAFDQRGVDTSAGPRPAASPPWPTTPGTWSKGWPMRRSPGVRPRNCPPRSPAPVSTSSRRPVPTCPRSTPSRTPGTCRR
jgi:hypothetical protein